MYLTAVKEVFQSSDLSEVNERLKTGDWTLIRSWGEDKCQVLIGRFEPNPNRDYP